MLDSENSDWANFVSASDDKKQVQPVNRFDLIHDAFAELVEDTSAEKTPSIII